MVTLAYLKAARAWINRGYLCYAVALLAVVVQIGVFAAGKKACSRAEKGSALRSGGASRY